MNQALRGEDRHSVGVLFINLDQFKRVNDSLGHTAADGLLQQVAERLLATLRSSDSAARVGGDEFAVLLPEAADEQAALDAVWRINDAMRRPFMVEQQELVVTASVGVALSPEDGSDFAALLRSADLAMSDAKAAGRDTVRRPLVRVHRGGGMAFETELRHALEHDELWVAYQPQIDLASRRIVGTEALVRWAHPARGQLRPDQFLPLAEELGLLGAIDEWALATALCEPSRTPGVERSMRPTRQKVGPRWSSASRCTRLAKSPPLFARCPQIPCPLSRRCPLSGVRPANPCR